MQAPNLDTRINTGEREVRLLTDAAGHRIGPDPRPEATYRVLALGDSYQAALQVEHEQTFTALLERRLTRDRQIAEITARAAGYEPQEIDPDQPSRRMTRELESLGLTVVDTTPALRAAHAAGRRDLFGRVDVHLDVGGHRAVADTVVPHLLAALDRRVEEAAGREGAGSPAPPGDRVAQRQAPARAQTLTERLLPPF